MGSGTQAVIRVLHNGHISIDAVRYNIKPGINSKDRRLKHGASDMSKKDRDIEKVYSTSEFVSKLRRFADALESGKAFEIQIAGERIYVPLGATFSIEHERGGSEEEIEFQINWNNE